MNTTTTMVESCSPSAPIDWWKLDSSSSSLFMGGDTARGAKASGSSGSTGERLRLDARKTDVCRLELDECPRGSFGGAEKSVTVHGVCNKTINGGGGGGGSSSSSSGGKFFNEGPAGPAAAVTSSAPPAGSCNSSGTVAAGTSAALAATIAQQHQQRTLNEQCEQHSSIRHNSNSSTSGRGSRQQEQQQQQAGIAVVDVDDGLGDAMPALMTPLFMPEVDWTNETCLGGGGLDFSSSIVADGGQQRLQQKQQQLQQHLWISSPASSSSNITDAELERQLEDYDYTATRDDLQQHLISISPYAQQQIGGGAVSFTTETSVDCGTLLARAPGGDDGGSPISLHEEIEQLSSGFDCDATNHLVSTSSAALELPFLASPSDEQQHGETMSLNILKWLQEDISSTIIVDRQQPQQQQHQHQHQHQQQQQHQQPQGLGGDILAAAISNSSHFLTDSAAIALSPSPADRLRLPLLEATFENSLDQIQTLNRSPTPAVGAGGGHKTALKSESSGSGRRHSDDPSAAAAAAFSTAAATSSSTTTTTTATNASSVDPQCDHNYFTMKRRIQDSGGGGGGDAHTSTKHKIIKLTDEHERQQSGHHRSVKESVTRSAPAASCWCADDASASTLQPRTTTGGPHKPHNTTTTATAVAGTFERRPSVAHRKAPTLKVHVGGGIAPTALAASLLSGQDPFLALNKTPMMTTTTTIATTTTTTTTNLINQHRMLPQVTLNTPDLTNDILDLEDEKFDLLSFIDTNDDSLDLNKYHSVVDEKPALEAVLPSASLKEGEGEEESHEGQQGLAAPKQSDANSGSSSSSSSSSSSTSSTSSVKNSPEKKVYPFLTLDSLRQMTASTTDASEDSTMARSALSSSTASLLRTQQHHLTAHLGSSNSNYSMGSRSSASSVCGDSDVSSSTTAQTPKRRGRPPKAVGTVRDRSQYEHLSEADWRYREQRDKNNEASRKSRINRKDRELKLESEADRLNMQHQKLSYEERRLQRDCQKWRKAVMKLALL
uniref:BZIP domain-containing protein n=1 Tax=Anopheles atroparvus TaxID=41427 RepID=A0AAG5DUU2_ANOAO